MVLEFFEVEHGFKDDLSRKKIGMFLKAVRKSNKMTQMDMSQIIQCAQGSVSKFEEGVMELSAIEMIRVCDALKIKIETFSRCYLDSKREASPLLRKENDLFKIPKMYTENCVYNIRGLNPLIHFAKKRLTEEKFNNIMVNDMKLDPSYLYLMDGQLNSQFIEDLSFFVEFECDEFASFFCTFFKTFQNHGGCHGEFSKTKSGLSAIKNFVTNSPLYDSAFERRIMFDTSSRIVLNYKIKRDNILENVIKDYHLKFLEQMATYCANHNEEIRIVRRQIDFETLSFEVVSGNG